MLQLILIPLNSCYGKKLAQNWVCVAYSGEVSDKPISNIIFSKNVNDFEKAVVVISQHKSLANKKFNSDIKVSFEELKIIRAGMQTFEVSDGYQIYMISSYEGKLIQRSYSIKTGIKIMGELAITLIEKENRDLIQRRFTTRMKGLLPWNKKELVP